MARILVPLDGSPLADTALPWAAAIARAESASIHLLAVYGYDEQLWAAANIDPSSPLTHVRELLEADLHRAANEPALAGLSVTSEARAGVVAAEIAAVAAEEDTAMAVIATHGRGGFRAGSTGSVADKLVRTLPIPVLVVPPHAVVRPNVTRVLVPLDGSEDSERVLAHARKVASGLDAAVSLLRAVDVGGGWGLTSVETAAVVDQLERAAGDYLRGVSGSGEETAVRRGRPSDAILAHARERNCELIAMATHGRSGPIRLELGSTADAVVRHADRPVLLVPVRD